MLFAMMGGVAGTLAEDRRGGDERGRRLLASVPANAKGARASPAAPRRVGLGRASDRARPGGLRLTVGSAQGRAMGTGDGSRPEREVVGREQALRGAIGAARYRGADDATAGPNALAGVARFVVSGSEPRVDVPRDGRRGERRVGRIDRSREIGRGNGDCARVVRDAAAAATKSASDRSPRRGRGNGGAEARRVSPVPELLRRFLRRASPRGASPTPGRGARESSESTARSRRAKRRARGRARTKSSRRMTTRWRRTSRDSRARSVLRGEPSGDAWMRVCVSVGVNEHAGRRGVRRNRRGFRKYESYKHSHSAFFETFGGHDVIIGRDESPHNRTSAARGGPRFRFRRHLGDAAPRPRVRRAGRVACPRPSGSVPVSRARPRVSAGCGFSFSRSRSPSLLFARAAADSSSVGCGFLHTCAVLSTGVVRCWGDNQYGQLGDGLSASNSSLPVTVSGISTASSVASGYYHSCSVLLRRFGSMLGGGITKVSWVKASTTRSRR